MNLKEHKEIPFSNGISCYKKIGNFRMFMLLIIGSIILSLMLFFVAVDVFGKTDKEKRAEDITAEIIKQNKIIGNAKIKWSFGEEEKLRGENRMYEASEQAKKARAEIERLNLELAKLFTPLLSK